MLLARNRAGPIDYGRRHFHRYLSEGPVIVRAGLYPDPSQPRGLRQQNLMPNDVSLESISSSKAPARRAEDFSS